MNYQNNKQCGIVVVGLQLAYMNIRVENSIIK